MNETNLFKEDLKSLGSISLLSGAENLLVDNSLLFEVDEECVDDFDKEVSEGCFKGVPQDFKSPATGSFQDYRDEMLKISDQIFKKTVKLGQSGKQIDLERAEVVYEYAMFLEGKEDPFVSSALAGAFEKVSVKEGIEPTLPGLFLALETMKRNEEAFFWIACELMYGKNGCPPRIPPSADILVRLKIVSVAEEIDEKAESKTAHEVLQKEARKMFKVAENHFSNRNFSEAIDLYCKWISKLERVHLKNSDEDESNKMLLIKMYQNVCVCYNKIAKPEKCCIMMRELERLTSIRHNAKALLAKGIANMMLENFEEARKYFTAAKAILPDSVSIAKAGAELDKRENRRNQLKVEHQKRLQQVMLEALQKAAETEKKANK